MIVNFTIENTLSINSKLTVSFEEPELTPHSVKIGNKFISKIKCIYGENGSGKTNLIQAVNFYINFMLNSFAELNPEESTHFVPFQFSESSQCLPGFFSISFFSESIRYDYELSLNNQEVILEKLYYSPNGQKSLLFQRDGADIKWGSSFSGAKKLIATTTRKNSSVLSVGAQLNNPILLAIYGSIRKWFKGFVAPDKGGLTGFTLSRIEEDENFKNEVIKLLKELNNSNITDIKIKSKPIPLEYLEDLPEEIRRKLLKRNTSPKNRKAILVHSYDNDYDLPLELESRGTQRLLELSTPMYDLTHSHSFLMMDELETSLHPKIQKYFIYNFLANTKGSQLLLTTHNIDLMDSGIFTDSEICFAMKDVKGNTSLYSVRDFTGVRKGVSRKHMYENGKFNQSPSKVRK